ncbi:MAG TPA: hypothetical protein VGD48_15360 [Kutzneria sp.]
MNDELKALRAANPLSDNAYQDASHSPEGLALLARITKTPQTRGSRRWFVVAGIGTAAAVVAVITGVGLFPVGGGGGAPPAFAVERTADDTLTVTVNNFSGSWGLNADLTRYGVRGRVVEMQQPTKDCVVSEEGKAALPPDALRPVPGAPNKITIKPREITPDTTLVFGRVSDAGSPPTLRVFAVRSSVDQPITCPAAGGGSTPARTTEPVVNPNAVNGNGADSNGLTPTPTR